MPEAARDLVSAAGEAAPRVARPRSAARASGTPQSQRERCARGTGTLSTDDKPCPEIVVIYFFIVAMDLI